jgi:hypothetical protein
MTMYVFRVRYQNGQERVIQSQCPFDQWKVRSRAAIPAAAKAVKVGRQRKVEVEEAAPPSPRL